MLSVGGQLGRNEQEIRPLIKKVVEDSWYDSIDSLRGLSDSEWLELGLPPRFRQALQARLRDNVLRDPTQPSMLPSSHPSIPASALPSHPTQSLPSRPLQSILPISTTLPAVLQSSNACRSHVLRILQNLATNDLKYRRIKINSSAFVSMTSAHPEILPFLLSLGFREEDEERSAGNTLEATSLSLSQPPHTLISECLTKFHAFDPYRATFSATAGAVTVPSNAAEERARRKPEEGPLRKEPPSWRLINEKRSGEQNSRSEDSCSSEDDLALLQSVIRARQPSTFKLRRDVNKAEITRNLYPTIRVIFPPRVLPGPQEPQALELKGFFRLDERVGRIKDMLTEKFLVHDLPPWYLHCVRRLKDEETLEQGGFGANVVVRMVMEEKGWTGRVLREPQGSNS